VLQAVSSLAPAAQTSLTAPTETIFVPFKVGVVSGH
jgi:hypothetical protein